MKFSLNKIVAALITAALISPDIVNCNPYQSTCHGEKQLSELMSDKNYTNFVLTLKNERLNFLDILKHGDGLAAGDVVDVVSTEIPVFMLKATQNEIGLDESLKFPLKNSKYLIQLLSATENTVIRPKGIDIVIADTNIIDGHHRWSTIALLNPTAKIGVVNIQNTEAVDALKKAQLAIAVVNADKNLPISYSKGINMLTLSNSQLYEYISNTIDTDVVENMKSFFNVESKLEVVDKIYNIIKKNLDFFKQNNIDSSQDISRPYMPQTDDEGYWKHNLMQGFVNVNPPYAGGKRKRKTNRKSNIKKKSRNTNKKRISRKKLIKK